MSDKHSAVMQAKAALGLGKLGWRTSYRCDVCGHEWIDDTTVSESHARMGMMCVSMSHAPINSGRINSPREVEAIFIEEK